MRTASKERKELASPGQTRPSDCRCWYAKVGDDQAETVQRPVPKMGNPEESERSTSPGVSICQWDGL